MEVKEFLSTCVKKFRALTRVKFESEKNKKKNDSDDQKEKK